MMGGMTCGVAQKSTLVRGHGLAPYHVHFAPNDPEIHTWTLRSYLVLGRKRPILSFLIRLVG